MSMCSGILTPSFADDQPRAVWPSHLTEGFLLQDTLPLALEASKEI